MMKRLVTAAAAETVIATGVWAEGQTHFVAVHVDQNDPQVMNERAGKDVPLMDEANMVPSGVVRLIELQEQDYAYIRP